MRRLPQDSGQAGRDSGPIHGHGASFVSAADATRKSFFEAFERKYSQVFDRSRLERHSYGAIVDRALDPRSLALVTDWERAQSPLPYVLFSQDLPLRWAGGYQVVDQQLRPTLIPATLLYSRYGWRHPDEWIAPNLSTGLACHTTPGNALAAGLLELVERDAFMLHWLHRHRPPRIDAVQLNLNEGQAALQALYDAEFSVHWVDLSTDIGLPVVLVAIEHRRVLCDETVVFGTACDLNVHRAAQRALLEALALLTNFVHWLPGESPRAVAPSRRQRFGLPSVQYHRLARFLIEGDVLSATSAAHEANDLDDQARFARVVAAITDAGHDVYFGDLTPEAYRGIADISLVRAFVTGLQPMLHETNCFRLCPSRLFGSWGGRLSAAREFSQLNLLPHPFVPAGE